MVSAHMFQAYGLGQDGRRRADAQAGTLRQGSTCRAVATVGPEMDGQACGDSTYISSIWTGSVVFLVRPELRLSVREGWLAWWLPPLA